MNEIMLQLKRFELKAIMTNLFSKYQWVIEARQFQIRVPLRGKKRFFGSSMLEISRPGTFFPLSLFGYHKKNLKRFSEKKPTFIGSSLHKESV